MTDVESINLLLRDIHGEIKVTNKRLEYLEEAIKQINLLNDRISVLHDRTSSLEFKLKSQSNIWRWFSQNFIALISLAGTGIVMLIQKHLI
jgi:hypothetical protein